MRMIPKVGSIQMNVGDERKTQRISHAGILLGLVKNSDLVRLK
jgi:hypothetical protein